MQEILPILRCLDEIYHTGSLDDYETLWQEVVRQVDALFPSFTPSHAEIFTEGKGREATGRGMFPMT